MQRKIRRQRMTHWNEDCVRQFASERFVARVSIRAEK